MDDKKNLILLFESDPLLCDLIQLSLEQQGYQVYVQRTPHEPLALIEKLRPAIILLDLFFPQTQTIQLIEQIHRLPFNPPIEIIVLSALGFREVVTKALDAGAKEYLLKPIDISLLIERVNKVHKAQTLKQEKTIKEIKKPSFPRIR